MDTISALTIDLKEDGWSKSRGFIQRKVPKPVLDEASDPTDAFAVIVDMHFAGICGSDRGMWNRTAFSEVFQQALAKEKKHLRIVGHEFIGKVIAAGSAVKQLFGITIGDIVSGDSHVTCGRCFQCRISEAEVCQDQTILGITMDGVFAEEVKLPAKNLWQIDLNRLRPEIAAILDPFGNAVHAFSKVDVRGARVAFFGCGQIGMFAILLARHFGAAKVIAVDVNPKNIEMAKELGAHVGIVIEEHKKEQDYDIDQSVIDRIMELTYGKGVDISLEMAGFNSSVNNCIAATRFGGQVILFGIKDGDFVVKNFSRMVMKGLTLHNVIGRQIFKTWQISQRILSDISNGMQDNIWNSILNSGKDTIIPFSKYSKKTLEQKMAEHPKLLLDMQR